MPLTFRAVRATTRAFGFKPEPGLVLPDVPPEYFMALSFDGNSPRGIVSYHEAFNPAGPQ
ncbi:hypothetical protein [Mitsuaria chitosanitabida]|uniref:hypothetical protein n=1 Tax=Roseateles chitosanitabidus TaxID=65048 RepID=UPI000ACFFCCD